MLGNLLTILVYRPLHREAWCRVLLLMIPSPSVASYRKSRLARASVHHRVLDALTRRSRLTNLGVFLLTGLCAVSLLANLWLLAPPLLPPQSHLTAFTTAIWPATRKNLDHLIIVPCHSIWQGTDSWSDEKDWLLEPYQRGPGRVRAFYQHISQRYISLLCWMPSGY